MLLSTLLLRPREHPALAALGHKRRLRRGREPLGASLFSNDRSGSGYPEPERRRLPRLDRRTLGSPRPVAHSVSPATTAASSSRTSKVSLPSSAPTTTLSPGLSDPSRTILESSLSTLRWIVRRNGRAP